MSKLDYETPSGDKITKGEYLFVNPNDIVADASWNGRSSADDRRAIERLAVSMHSVGQSHPILVRRLGSRLAVYVGFRRLQAANLIKKHLDPNFKVKVIVSDIDEQQAFLANVSENRERKETTVIDDAFNAVRLRDKYGYTDAQVARALSLHQQRLPFLYPLVSLPADIRDRVASGEISATHAAKVLAPIGDDAKIREIVNEATIESGGEEVYDEPDDPIMFPDDDEVGSSVDSTTEDSTDTAGGDGSEATADGSESGNAPSESGGEVVAKRKAGRPKGSLTVKKTKGKVKSSKLVAVAKKKGAKVDHIAKTLADIRRFFSERQDCPASAAIFAYLCGEVSDNNFANLMTEWSKSLFSEEFGEPEEEDSEETGDDETDEARMPDRVDDDDEGRGVPSSPEVENNAEAEPKVSKKKKSK